MLVRPTGGFPGVVAFAMSLPQTIAVEASNGEAAYPAVLMNVRIASRVSHVEMRRRVWRAAMTMGAVLLSGRRFARKRV
ncbi:hypothetical protein BOSE21B_10851 [Bosea sp. 21B]|nr:hypothetical protein BOSE21B_10851 [Bosea sp. 21B]CAD5262922.1 hypothetical protein BOSE7B_150287 [Bosea sp. 7B]